MTTTTTPHHITTTGEFNGTRWEVWPHADAPAIWGYSLGHDDEHQSTAFYATPDEAREAAFITIARTDAAIIKAEDHATPPEQEQEYRYTIVSVGGRNVGGGEEWQVHAAGCRDVARLERQRCDTWTTNATSAAALVAWRRDASSLSGLDARRPTGSCPAARTPRPPDRHRRRGQSAPPDPPRWGACASGQTWYSDPICST